MLVLTQALPQTFVPSGHLHDPLLQIWFVYWLH